MRSTFAAAPERVRPLADKLKPWSLSTMYSVVPLEVPNSGLLDAVEIVQWAQGTNHGVDALKPGSHKPKGSRSRHLYRSHSPTTSRVPAHTSSLTPAVIPLGTPSPRCVNNTHCDAPQAYVHTASSVHRCVQHSQMHALGGGPYRAVYGGHDKQDVNPRSVQSRQLGLQPVHHVWVAERSARNRNPTQRQW